FERPPWPLAVKWRPADPYIESKIYAERLLLRAAARGSDDLAIVRLGNVIGPAAPIWIASLAQRILEARPVGYTSGLGYANATSIDNVGSYICELVRCPSSDLADMGTFHHLAEFSGYSWREILDRVAAIVGKRYVLVEPATRPHTFSVASARGVLMGL